MVIRSSFCVSYISPSIYFSSKRREWKQTNFLVRSKGSKQGCPLAGLSYGILLLPLIIQLKSKFSQIKSPWYADDGTAAGTLTKHYVIF